MCGEWDNLTIFDDEDLGLSLSVCDPCVRYAFDSVGYLPPIIEEN